MAGCGGSFLYSLCITISVTVITYNIIVSSNTTLSSGFPTSRKTLASPALSDPVIRMPVNRASYAPRRPFHTAVTSSDSLYNTWQSRVMYYWFKNARAAAGPGSEMGGFTRILHSGKSDRFMDVIPTFVADPLPPGSDQGYIVLNRPCAFVQWLKKADIQEEYILMAEPDHLIVKPIPNLSKDGLAAAFPFFYIEPKKYESTLRKFFPVDKGEITDIDPIGNSPVIIDKASLMKIAPTWMNVSLAMKKDPEADKAFGWVLEMYAYAVASALHGVGNILHKDFMIQPPWDLEVGEKFIIHYTYGCDFDTKGKSTYGRIGEWRFDKRSYNRKPPPRNLPLPPNGVPQSVSRSLFLKNLNFKTNDDSLREHFSGKIKKGSIKSVKVKKHLKNGKNVSMGFGFIEFDSLETATSVCLDFQGTILDRHALILQLSCQKRRPGPEEE